MKLEAFLAPQIIELIKSIGAKAITFGEDMELKLAAGIPVDMMMYFSAGGAFEPMTDLILINERGDSPNHSAMHEIIHWTGTRRRMCRPSMVFTEMTVPERMASGKMLTQVDVATEEMTAQLGMLMLSEFFGVEVTHAKEAYNRYNMLFGIHADMVKVEKDAREAVDFVLQMALDNQLEQAA